MRRTLPTIAAALVVTGLLAAVVIAAPDSSPSRASNGDGPLAILRERPIELQPQLQEFEPPPAPRQDVPANPQPPLEPLDQLAPDITDQPSRAIGKPWKGRLENGVQLPAQGTFFFTFDSALRVSPSRDWRRWGTDLNVSRTLQVLRELRAAHPDAARIGIGDLSRPRGGPFGRKYGGLGHASHQNGQDVDVYYPRLDRTERPPRKPNQVDRRLSQELVDRFVAAGAQMVFVGPRVGLRGPRGVVMKLVHHDNHLHVRWPKR